MFGAIKGLRQKLKFDAELLYVAALSHDLGLRSISYSHKRFEVDGAAAAREFLRSHSIPDLKADLVWEAIALHTTPAFPNTSGPRLL
jgi:HD superfamily phosphodiesterase